MEREHAVVGQKVIRTSGDFNGSVVGYVGVIEQISKLGFKLEGNDSIFSFSSFETYAVKLDDIIEGMTLTVREGCEKMTEIYKIPLDDYRLHEGTKAKVKGYVSEVICRPFGLEINVPYFASFEIEGSSMMWPSYLFEECVRVHMYTYTEGPPLDLSHSTFTDNRIRTSSIAPPAFICDLSGFKVIKPFTLADVMNAKPCTSAIASLMEELSTTDVTFSDIDDLKDLKVAKANSSWLLSNGFIEKIDPATDSDRKLEAGMQLENAGTLFKYTVVKSGDGENWNRYSILLDKGEDGLMIWHMGLTLSRGTTLGELNEHSAMGGFKIVGG
ncbi:MAG: hypothetical protein GY799_20910 [Desulfobulbaceae bacterium]|nr:hypothetical protein [Desulfobulbaceae bacterium]